MKKQRFFMLGIITVLVAVLSLTFVSSTFAKYTSTVSGSDSARVAKWAWDYKGSALAKETATVAFDLFDTINDTKDPYGDETDVADTLIAPGTQGSFVISFQNKSEVTANLKVTFAQTETDATLPIEFSFAEDFATAVDDIADLIWNEDLGIGSGAVTKTVYWRWVFDGSDSVDIALGWKGTDTITVTMNVVFTQVD